MTLGSMIWKSNTRSEKEEGGICLSGGYIAANSAAMSPRSHWCWKGCESSVSGMRPWQWSFEKLERLLLLRFTD